MKANVIEHVSGVLQVWWVLCMPGVRGEGREREGDSGQINTCTNRRESTGDGPRRLMKQAPRKQMRRMRHVPKVVWGHEANTKR